MLRGADVVIQTLKATGVESLFTLSGNQIMSVFDASIGAGIDLIHVRHEAAAVHMADAWGRLTGNPGVALVTAGPGFANCLSALYVAKMAESPLVLLSGQAPNDRAGVGAFQDMSQAEMASYVSKASWTTTDPRELSKQITRAVALSKSGRPGPVHLSLPVNVLEATLDQPADLTPQLAGDESSMETLTTAEANGILDVLAEAHRPMVLVGPSMSRGVPRSMLESFSREVGVPIVGMESPRGINDPSLGALAEVLPCADLVVLLAKDLDFTLQVNSELAFDSDCRFIHLYSDKMGFEIAQRVIPDPSLIVFSAIVDPLSSITAMSQAASRRPWQEHDWCQQVESAISYRPPAWIDIDSQRDGPLHPVEVCRRVQEYLDQDETVFVSDGGEFGQWAQACLSARHRVINGPAGAIGGSVPFALAASLAFPGRRIVVTLGDGTFGFHSMEFDTAVRYQLPFVAVVGNDATWNAEYQIQLRNFGRERTVGCELLPTRYEKVVESLGGHGEYITASEGILPALRRAEESGLPACLNVPIQRTAAPVIRRNA